MENPNSNAQSKPVAPRFTKGLSFVGWAYNGERCIGEYLEKAEQLLNECVDDYEIIVVNDGSVDRTREIVLEHAEQNPRIRLVDNPGNQGVAYACRNALASAQKEFLMWQTVDWSYDISRLREYLQLLNDCDVVAGVRRRPVQAVNRIHRILLGIMKLVSIKHITRRSDTLWKACVSLINYMLIRTLFNVPLSDYQNVCIYRSSLIKSINSEAMSSFSNPEFLFKAYWSGARIAEVPIDFIPRKYGEAKGTRFSSIRQSVSEIFRFWYRWVVRGGIDRNNPGSILRLAPDEK